MATRHGNKVHYHVLIPMDDAPALDALIAASGEPAAKYLANVLLEHVNEHQRGKQRRSA